MGLHRPVPCLNLTHEAEARRALLISRYSAGLRLDPVLLHAYNDHMLGGLAVSGAEHNGCKTHTIINRRSR